MFGEEIRRCERGRRDEGIPPRANDLGGGHDVEVATAVQRRCHFRKELESAGEAARRAAETLGNRVEFSARTREEGEDAIRFAEITRSQNDRVGGVGPLVQRVFRPLSATVSASGVNASGRSAESAATLI